MRKNLTKNYLEKFAEARGLKIQNNKRQLDFLLEKFKAGLDINTADWMALVQKACTTKETTQPLHNVFVQMLRLEETIYGRFYKEKNLAMIAQDKNKKLRQQIFEQNRQEPSIFEKYHKDITYIENQEHNLDIILMITSPFDILEISLISQIEMKSIHFVQRKISQSFYSYSLLDRDMLIAALIDHISLEIKLSSNLCDGSTIKINNLKPYLDRYQRTGTLIIDFSDENLYNSRNTGILYSIGALTLKKEEKSLQRDREIAYEWLALLFSGCFHSILKSDFDNFTNFAIMNMEDLKVQAISRYYIYILREISKNIISLKEFLRLDNKLIRSLIFPLINKERYNLKDHISELEQIYIQFCMNYSLKVDKKIKCKASMAKLAIFNIEEKESLNVLQKIIEDERNLLEDMSDNDLMRIVDNKYLTVQTSFWILLQVIQERQKVSKNKSVDETILKFMEKIVQKLPIAKTSEVWNEKIQKQELQRLLIKDGALVIRDKDKMFKFYKYAKELGIVENGVSTQLLSIIKEDIQKNVKEVVIFTPQILQAVTLKPIDTIDYLLTQRFRFDKLSTMSQLQELFQKRLRQPERFQLDMLDHHISKYIQFLYQKHRSAKIIIDIVSLFDKIAQSSIAVNREKLIAFCKWILDSLNFKNLRDLKNELYELISTAIKLKTFGIKRELMEKTIKTIIDQRITFTEEELQISFGNINFAQNEQYYHGILSSIQQSSKTEEERVKQYWQILIEEKRCISKMKWKKKRNPNVFKITMDKIVSKIVQNDLFVVELEKAYSNIVNIGQFDKQLGVNYANIVKDCNHQYESFKQCLRSLKEILTQFGNLTYEVKQINNIRSQLLEIKLKSAYQMQEKSKSLRDLIANAMNIKELVVSSTEFNKSQVKKLEDILQQYQQIKRNVEKKLNKLKDQNYIYKDFQQLKISTHIEKWCKILFRQSQTDIILKKIQELKIENLRAYKTMIQSFNSLKVKIQGSPDQQCEPFLRMFTELQHSKQVFVSKILSQLQKAKQLLVRNYNLLDANSIFTEQVIQIAELTVKHEEMITTLQKSGIDSEIIMNLKESIINQIYSNLKLEDIQQFQSVVAYSNQIKKHRSIQSLINHTKVEIIEEKIQLSENIKHCAKIYQEILSKIKRIQNKENTFKDQILLILNAQNNSIFNIQQTKQPDVLRYYLLAKIPQSNPKRSSPVVKQFQQKMIDFKLLKEYKQTCLIFKNEVENKKEQQQLSIVFNKYLIFFEKISIIKKESQKSLEYGYCVNKLLKKIEINISNDFKGLNDHIAILERGSRTWQQQIKKSYESSFIFTFYMGKKIDVLIEGILSRQLPSMVKNICQISGQQFQNIYEIQTFKNLSIEVKDEIEKLRKTVTVLKQIETICLVKRLKQQQHEQVKKMKKNRITLSFTDEQKYIYQLSPREEMPKIYEMFFCLSSTTLLELEIFLNRCFKLTGTTCYVIGAHHIREQLKNDFFQLIKAKWRKSDRNKDIQLKFIDDRTTDLLYLNVKWCSEMDVFEQKQQLTFEKNKAMVENALKNVELVTSQRPGLGKTYYVQQYAKSYSQQLLRFPISGNIDFDSILNRLKRQNLQNKCILIQIGYIKRNVSARQSMGDLEKLQIFLMMILLMRAFHHKGEYIYFGKEVKIFIQMENLFYNEANKQIYESRFGLTNLLEKIQNRHHIKEFLVDKIHFQTGQLKQAYVLAFFQLLDKKNINNSNIAFQQFGMSLQDVDKLQQCLNNNDYFQYSKSLNEKIMQQELKRWELDRTICHCQSLFKLILYSWTQKTHYNKQKSNEDTQLIINGEEIEEQDERQQEQHSISKRQSLNNVEQQLDNIRQKANNSLSTEEKINLVNKYFVKNCSRAPTYRSYQYFIAIIFEKVKTFAQSYAFSVSQAAYYRSDVYLRKTELPQIRQKMFKTILQNTIKILEESTIYQITQSKNMDQRKEYIKKGNFYENLYSSPTIILSSKDNFGYEFIYRRVDQVDFSIKSFTASQNSAFVKKINADYRYNRIREDIAEQFKKQAFDLLPLDKQEEKMMNTFFNLSNKAKFNQAIKDIYESVKGLKDYKLTIDNFYKICYIIQKANCFTPIIIMGQSGVGKTALIKFTVKQIFEEILLFYNVHAGIHLQDIEKWVKQIIKKAEEKPEDRLWVFFDEFNTSDELSYIKQIVIDRRFIGQLLPKNVVFCTASNPYRMKQNTNKTRAFNVKPPNLSMISLMWDYEQLKEQECQSYCFKMLKELPFKLEQVVKAIVAVHQYIHTQYQLSYASLRDVARFKQLYQWFYKSIPREPLKTEEKDYSAMNYNLSLEERSTILAFCFVYSLKFSSSQDRSNLLKKIEQIFSYQEDKFMQKVLERQQIDFVIRLKFSDMKIAYNKALRQNLFTSFACILNKIPVLLIGHPGSSKSLSTKLINSNLRGKFSKNKFCQQFPQFLFYYFQGSESSTSEGILRPFQISQKPKPQGTQYLIVLDELGIAEKSVHNPTKVLHSKLETDSKLVSTIGMSNQQLEDCSKMSRFLIVQRSQPQREQLIETASKIYESYFPNNNTHINLVKQFAQLHDQFKSWWSSRIQRYYGQRDFYSSIRYLCNKIMSGRHINRDQLFKQAILINYDGYRQKNEVSTWLIECTKMAKIPQILAYPKILNVIKENISNADSRYLLFIVKQNSIIQRIIQKFPLEIKDKMKTIKCIHCSPSVKDNQSQQYNYEFTSNIISEMARGSILSINELTKSIQTSLYDLFNRSYVSIGKKNYCRIAVGATSNSNCYLNPEFSIILFMKEENYKSAEGAFMNRFEKHFINIFDELTQREKEQFNELQKWLTSVAQLWKDNPINNRENYLVNIDDYSLASLIIKSQTIQNQEKIEYIKSKILQNSTIDLQILVKRDQQPRQTQSIAEQIKKLKKNTNKYLCDKSVINIVNNPLKFDKNDVIIFTYSTMEDIKEANQEIIQDTGFKIEYIKVGETEKALKQNLIRAFQNKATRIIEIDINFQRENTIIDYLLFFVKQLKKVEKSHQQIRIVIQMSRYSVYKKSQHKDKKLNISFLHDYQQFFYDHITQKMFFYNNQSELFDYLFSSSSKLADIYAQSIPHLNIEAPRTKFSITDHVQFLLSRFNDQKFQAHTLKIIQSILSRKKIDYNIMVNNEAVTFNNIKELFINYLRKKVIFIYQLILQRLSQHNLLMHLASDQQKKTRFIEKDLNNSSFKKYYEQYQHMTNVWELIEEELCSTDIEELMNHQKHRLIINNQVLFVHSSTNFVLKNIFKIDKESPYDNLEFQALKFFNTYSEQYEAQRLKQILRQLEKSLSDLMQRKHLKELNSLSKGQQFLLINDIIKYYLHLLTLKDEDSSFITEVILSAVCEESSFEEKMFILLFSRDFAKNIFQLIIVLKQYYNAEQIIIYFKKKQKKFAHNLKDRFQSNLGNFFQNIKSASQKCTWLQNVDRIGGNFICFSRLVYDKKENLENGCLQPLENTSSSLSIVFNCFYGLIERISKNAEDGYAILMQYCKFAKRSFNYLSVLEFCQKLFENAKTSATQNIIRFLACDLYTQYAFEKDKDLKGQGQQQIFNYCFDLSEKYTIFANLLSISYLPAVFQDYFSSSVANFTNDYQRLRVIQEKEVIGQIPNSAINFKIVLGLYFRTVIKNKMQQFFDDEHAIIDKCLECFKTIYSNALNNVNTPISEIYSYEFLKIYYQKYTKIIFGDGPKNRSEDDACRQISKTLHDSSTNSLKKHLLIYILKFIYHEYVDPRQLMVQISSKIKSYPWLSQWKELLPDQQDNTNYELPLDIYSSQSETFCRFFIIKQSRYKSADVKQLIVDSLKSPRCTYELLTVFSTILYSEQFNDQFLSSLEKFINQIEELQQRDNLIIKSLLSCYLKKRLTRQISFKKGEMDKYRQMLPLLNFLNLICAYRKINCCFIQMFFKEGKPIVDFSSQMQSKYIFGTINNPQLIRCMTLIETTSRNFNYFKCTNKNCNYLLKICSEQYILSFRSGNIFSSKILEEESCLLCNNSQMSFERIQPQSFVKILESLSQFYYLEGNKNYQLKGYQQGKSFQDISHYAKQAEKFIKSQIYGENAFNLDEANNILQLVQFFVWYVFSELNITKCPIQNGQIKKTYEHLKKTVIQSKSQKDVNVCLYAMAKLLEETMNESKSQQNSLINQVSKINFQLLFNKKIKTSFGLQEEKTLKMNKFARFPTKLDILEESGNIVQHQKQYKLIRFFKYIPSEFMQEENIRNVEFLSHSYEPLHYIWKNYKLIEVTAKKTEQIYRFVYKIWLEFNFQLQRNQLNTPISEIIAKIGNQEDKAIFYKQLDLFYQNWNDIINQENIFLDKKYNMQDFALCRFILDNKSRQRGPMLSFIQLTAQKYNATCQIIQEKLRRHYNKNGTHNYFSTTRINPTLVQQPFWKLSSMDDIINSKLQEDITNSNKLEEIINSNKYHSIIYGIKSYQLEYNLIQQQIIKYFKSTNYLITSKKQFKYFYFVDDDSQIEESLKVFLNEELTEAEKIIIQKEYKNNHQRLELFVSKLNDSIQKILSYLKYFNNNLELTVGEFIRGQRENHFNIMMLSSIQQSQQGEEMSQMQVHPLKHLDKVLLKDAFSRLRIKKLISLQTFIQILVTKSQQQQGQKNIKLPKAQTVQAHKQNINKKKHGKHS